jgi:ribosomal protein L11 methyltransferase
MADPAAVPAQWPDPSPAPSPAPSWTATVTDCPDIEVAAARLWLAGAVAVEVRGPTLVAHFTERVDPAATDLAQFGAGEGQRSPGISWSRLPAVDHMAAWRAASTPVRAGRFDLVPAHLADEHVTPSGLHRILVDAGMAFGSGHHDTTAGCLEALSAIDVRGQRVLDVGTGTGVLAIAAARSGAVDVVGVDTDPQAIEVARANVATNRVDVALGVGSTEVVAGPFDGILANLLTNLVVDLATDLAALLAPGGWLVPSGIGIPRVPAVVAALAAAGFRGIETRHRGDWAVLTAVRGPDRGREAP